MNNLFSVFDPCGILGIQLNWFTVIILASLIPNGLWMMSRRYHDLYTNIKSKVFTEFNAILLGASPGSAVLGLSLILFIAYTNFLGLLPYVFTSSSHLTFCVSLALPLWLGHMIMASVKTPTSVLSHLVPSGSPMALAPFMVLIEMTSNVIRPLTLSVRLTANMVAGHLLLSLASSSCAKTSMAMLSMVFIALITLTLLESAVALIQAYVFSILNMLYIKEVDSSRLSL